jgi:hypothetical protein
MLIAGIYAMKRVKRTTQKPSFLPSKLSYIVPLLVSDFAQ